MLTRPLRPSPRFIKLHPALLPLQNLIHILNGYVSNRVFFEGGYPNSRNSVPTLADSGFFKNFLHQDGIKSTVSWVFKDLKLKISEGYNQNWSEPSEILNLRSLTTPKTKL